LDLKDKVNCKIGDFGLSQQSGTNLSETLATWFVLRKKKKYSNKKKFLGNGLLVK
jgi:hypothetical protein